MAKQLAAANAIQGASIVGVPGGWNVIVKYGEAESPLSAQRSKKVRLWRSLDSCVAYVKNELGIDRVAGLDASNFSAHGLQRKRSDTASRMKSTHEAAAYDKWFRTQVQESLDDPHPGVPHDEVEVFFSSRRAELEKWIETERRKA